MKNKNPASAGFFLVLRGSPGMNTVAKGRVPVLIITKPISGGD